MMAKDYIIYGALFVFLVLFQSLICNHISIFNVAFPIIFIYFIIRLPISLKDSYLFSLAFALGLIIDIFSDTLGINALACTLLAGIKKPVFFAYVDHDDQTKKLIPTMKSLGFPTYAKYLLSMVAIYCLLSFTLEYFSFANVKELVVLSSSSCLLSFLIILAIDCLIVTKS